MIYTLSLLMIKTILYVYDQSNSLLMIKTTLCWWSKQLSVDDQHLSMFMIKSTLLINDQNQNNPLGLWSNQLSLLMIKTTLCFC